MDKCKLLNVCRTCLQEDGKFQSIFVHEIISDVSIQLCEIINSFTTLQIFTGDGLPDQICGDCAANIMNVFYFKLQCEKNDRTLRDRFQSYTNEEFQFLDNPIKFETLDTEASNEATTNCDKQEETALEDFSNFDVDVNSYSSINDDTLNDSAETIPQNSEQPPVKNFECDVCQKKFSRSDLLLTHKIVHAVKMEEQIMEQCQRIKEKSNILNHMQLKGNEFLKPDLSLLFIQKELDAENNKKLFSCEICGKSFTKLSHKNRHKKCIHLADKHYKCSMCSKTFLRKEQFNYHINSHTGLKPHTCSVCYKGFNQISNLKDHMRTHNGDKPFLCSTCGKGFNQLGNLRQHTIRHSGVKAHLCNTCGNGFASKGELSAHLRKHTGARPFVCSVCNHGFTTSSSLTKHKRIHSGEKPYECDTCKMKFSRSGILARHKRTHTGEKPYKCKFCGKAFSQSNDLTSHLRIHTGEKPYICDQCGQAFRQSSALKTHKKTHIEKSPAINSTINGFLPMFS